VSAYLSRWALYDDREVAAALAGLKPSAASPYIFGYFHGWELLQPWVTGSDRIRRLLTKQLLRVAFVVSRAKPTPGFGPLLGVRRRGRS
jgi:hypothetical protein